MRRLVWEPKVNIKQQIYMQHRISGATIAEASRQAGVQWRTGDRWEHTTEFQADVAGSVKETVERIKPTETEMDLIKKIVMDASVYSTKYLTEVVQDDTTDKKTRIDIAKFFCNTFFVPLYNTGSMNKPDVQVQEKSSEIEDLFLSVS